MFNSEKSYDLATLPHSREVSYEIINGDCVEAMRALEAESVDCIVTDPPYELGFMGKKWDASGIAYSVELWQEALRVLKPGGYLLAFGGTRTYHRMTCAIEDAGFEIRDCIQWLYGTGFPKSLNVGKALDKMNGKNNVDLSPFGAYVKERRLAKQMTLGALDEAMGTSTAASWWEGRKSGVQLPSLGTYGRLKPVLDMDDRFDSLIEWAEAEREVLAKKSIERRTQSWETAGGMLAPGEKCLDLTAPATDEAKQWEGWGTALKPANEPIVMARKPLSEKNVASNVLKHGTGAINIDATRIGTEQTTTRISAGTGLGDGFHADGATRKVREASEHANTPGRWPANVILDEAAAAVLDEQAGQEASRYFYVAKPAKKERDAGMEGDEQLFVQWQTGNGASGNPSSMSEGRNTTRKNVHPTVKPITLMGYLIRMVCPPGGTVLDPFLGSGTTGCAAVQEEACGHFIGIERDEDYVKIARARIEHWSEHGEK